MNVSDKMNTLLQQSRQTAEGILEAASDSIVTFDAETLKIDVFNLASEKLFGLDLLFLVFS